MEGGTACLAQGIRERSRGRIRSSRQGDGKGGGARAEGRATLLGSSAEVLLVLGTAGGRVTTRAGSRGTRGGGGMGRETIQPHDGLGGDSGRRQLRLQPHSI